MCLRSIFIVTAAINLVSSKDGTVTIELSLPGIFNQLLDINKSLNALLPSTGYNGEGVLENSSELGSNKKANEAVDQRRSDNNSTNIMDFDFIKINLKGFDDVTTLKPMRRADLVEPEIALQVENLQKKSPNETPQSQRRKVKEFLEKMRKKNGKRKHMRKQMRKQMNSVPNVADTDMTALKVKFPALFED